MTRLHNSQTRGEWSTSRSLPDSEQNRPSSGLTTCVPSCCVPLHPPGVSECFLYMYGCELPRGSGARALWGPGVFVWVVGVLAFVFACTYGVCVYQRVCVCVCACVCSALVDDSSQPLLIISYRGSATRRDRSSPRRGGGGGGARNKLGRNNLEPTSSGVPPASG